MNKLVAPVPLEIITCLPWRMRETLHLKLRNRCPRNEIARWLASQSATEDIRACHEALERYGASAVYRDWLEKDRRAAVITHLMANGPTAPRGNRLALSLALDQLQMPGVSTAAGTGWSGL